MSETTGKVTAADKAVYVAAVTGKVVRGVRSAKDSVLDGAGRPLAGPATKWYREAERRREMRTPDTLAKLTEARKAERDAMRALRGDQRAAEKARSEVAWWNVFNGEWRAARAVVRDSKRLAREASNDRRDVQRAYPLSMTGLATRCHAAHATPTFLWSILSDSVLSTLAVSGSVAAVAANVAVVWLGGRHYVAAEGPDNTNGLTPSQEEADLLQRLDPQAFQRFAEPRKLSDVVADSATLTESGIQAKLILNNDMDVDKLRKAEQQLRAALRMREGTRLEIRPGKTGGYARLTIRTRTKADGVDLSGWYPGACWAIDTVTGEEIPVPLGKRILFAGTSGSGKSFSARPLMAEASERDDHRLVIFDRKYIEGRTWNHRARIATELPDMRAVIEELTAEGESRLKTLPRGEDVVPISPSQPRIVVFVDEGAETLDDCKIKTKVPVETEDGKTKMVDEDFMDVVEGLRTIARKYRAAEIILVWATQKPTLSGNSHGLDSQIAGQMTMRLSLALSTATESRVVFGDDATDKGWNAHELPMKGYAMLRDQDKGSDQSTNILKLRYMTAKDVIALPARPIWSRSVSSTGASKAHIAARKDIEQKGAPADPWAGKDAGEQSAEDVTLVMPETAKARKGADWDDEILGELAARPGQSLSAVAKSVGAHKQTVKRRLGQMQSDDLVHIDADGRWFAGPAPE